VLRIIRNRGQIGEGIDIGHGSHPLAVFASAAEGAGFKI
jgi:hypothetical protein